ncbi:cold-shock protein [Phytomonospora sp. NPDC050363]|uniref:cold-shock protein n=1 Tax=Phytomonospora sp. NPDC050363 TaxID=3155642 RepID=UPI0033EB6DB9
MQGTVATFDPQTRTGTVYLDDGTQLGYDAEAFTASGLRLLRLGQRVRLVTDAQGRVRSLAIPTM